MPADAGRITAQIDGDISGLKSALGQARSEATSAVSGIEGKFKSGFGSGLQSSISGMTASMGPLGGAIDGVAGSLGLAGMATVGAVAGLAMVGSAAVSTAANWESLMASVSKTTGVEGSGLSQLSNDLQQIRMETGATAEGIASAVTTAGSIGIPTEELASFTEVAMQMGSAFGMSAEAASEAMGKIGNVVKPAEMSWTEFSTKAGSAVNDLADSMATSEAEILTGMKHLGATMALLKPPADTIPAWTAMVATVQSLGLAGDQAGEAIQDALQYATKDLKGGISGLLGMSKEELQINLRTNAPEVMQEAAAAIAALPLEEQGEALASFGQTGQKAIALLMGDLDPASGKFEKLGDAIDTANSGWKEGASLAEAYEKSQQTVNVAIDRLGATLDVAGQKMGTGFLPSVAEGINFLTDFVTVAIKVGETLDDWGVDEAIGKVWDLTPLGMMQDSEALQGAWADAKEWAGIGEDIGSKVGEGVSTSDDLAAAPGEALGSPEALNKVGGAADEAGATYADRFSELVKSGISKEIAGWMATDLTGALTDEMALALINAQTKINGDDRNEAGLRKTTLKSGLEVELKYQTDDGQTRSTLLVNGQEVAGPVYGWGIEKTLPELFRRAGLDYDETNVLDLTNQLGDAAILRATDAREIVVDSFLDVSTGAKSEIQAAGRTIADAFTKGLVPDKTQIDASLESLRNLKLYDPEDAKAQGADNAIAYLDALSDAIESYDEAKAKYLVEPDNDRAKDDLIRTRDNLQDILDQNPLTVNLFGNVKKESFDIDMSKAISSMEELKKVAGTDYMEFMRNTWQPALQDEIDWYADAWHSGVIEMQTQSATYLGDLVNKAREMPDLFTGEQIEALRDYAKGLIDVGEALDRLNGKAETTNTALGKLAETPKAASVGYNQLQKAVEDCESCLMSDFGAWQEAQDNLFNPSYIGESGQKYLDWKNTVTSAANEAAMAMKGFGYSLPPIFSGEQTQQSIPVSVKLDTSAATSALTEFEGTAKKDVQKPLTLDSTKATASISEVDTAAQKAAVKPLTLDSSQATASISAVDTAAQKSAVKPLIMDTSAAMSAIASINAAASQPVYKTVYVNEVYTGSSGGGGSGGGGGGFGYSLPPIFMARGGYVSRPTLAVVGEAGPEYVIPAENMAKGLSRMGGSGEVSVTINSPIYGGGGQDIEALLAERNKELVAEITEQIVAARRGL